jgi:hypothetical protein
MQRRQLRGIQLHTAQLRWQINLQMKVARTSSIQFGDKMNGEIAVNTITRLQDVSVEMSQLQIDLRQLRTQPLDAGWMAGNNDGTRHKSPFQKIKNQAAISGTAISWFYSTISI